MTAPLPPYRVAEVIDGYATVIVQLPDFTEGRVVLRNALVGTPEGDAAIRQLVDGRESTKDILRGEI